MRNVVVTKICKNCKNEYGITSKRTFLEREKSEFCSPQCNGKYQIKTGGQKDEKNPAWKGDSAKYFAKHQWIYRKKGKAFFCSFNPEHKFRVYQWANISGAYLRDINDYSSLCWQCHKEYDWIRAGKPKTRNEITGVFIKYGSE